MSKREIGQLLFPVLMTLGTCVHAGEPLVIADIPLKRATSTTETQSRAQAWAHAGATVVSLAYDRTEPPGSGFYWFDPDDGQDSDQRFREQAEKYVRTMQAAVGDVPIPVNTIRAEGTPGALEALRADPLVASVRVIGPKEQFIPPASRGDPGPSPFIPLERKQ